MMEVGNYSFRGDADFDDVMNSFTSEYRNEAVVQIYTYVLPVLLGIGTLLNLFVGGIMFRLSYTVLSTCSYLSLLAIMDLILLHMQCGRQWANHAFDLDIEIQLQKSSKSACKLYPFFKNFLLHFHSWIMVAIVIDCVIISRFPDKILRMCKVERSQAIMMLLTVLLVLLNIQFFWTFEIIEDDKMPVKYQKECLFNTYGNHFATEFRDILWPVMDFTFGYGIPLIIVSVCCVVVVVSLCKTRGSARSIELLGRLLEPNAVKEMRRTLVILCVLHVIMTSPALSILVYDYINDLMKTKETPVLLADVGTDDVPRALCKITAYVFMSCKFFLYIVSSSKFRSEFVTIWVKAWKSLACTKPIKRYGKGKQTQAGYDPVQQEMDSPRRQVRAVNGTPV